MPALAGPGLLDKPVHFGITVQIADVSVARPVLGLGYVLCEHSAPHPKLPGFSTA